MGVFLVHPTNTTNTQGEMYDMIGNQGALAQLLGPDCYTEDDAVNHFRNRRDNRVEVVKARQAKLNDMSSRRINYRRRLQSKIEEYQIAIDEVTN